jgi:hypothetical protein
MILQTTTPSAAFNFYILKDETHPRATSHK